MRKYTSKILYRVWQKLKNILAYCTIILIVPVQLFQANSPENHERYHNVLQSGMVHAHQDNRAECIKITTQ
jgi:hypothetical protein